MSPPGSAPPRPFPLPTALARHGPRHPGDGRRRPAAGPAARGFPSARRSLSAPCSWRPPRSRRWRSSPPAGRPCSARGQRLPACSCSRCCSGPRSGSASAGLMEVQSLLAPPPPAYLDAFRAIHHGARAPRPRRRPGVAPGDRGAARALRGARGARRVPALARPRVGGSSGAAGRGRRAPLRRSSTSTRTASRSPSRSGSSSGCCALSAGSLWPSVVAHLTLNTLTFLVAPFVDDPSQPYTPSPLLGPAVPRGRTCRRVAAAARAREIR